MLQTINYTALGCKLSHAFRQSHVAVRLALKDLACREGWGAVDTERLQLLGRVHDSVIYLMAEPVSSAPDGLLIKLPANRHRAERWPVLDEAERLRKLADSDSKDPAFHNLRPVAASAHPPFLVLPYYPSQTLKDCVVRAMSPRASQDDRQLASDSCYRAGRWLGMMYAATNVDPKSGDKLPEHERTQRNDSIPGSVPPPEKKSVEVAGQPTEAEQDHVANSQCVHGDYVPGNILVGKDHRLCVIDPRPKTCGPFFDYVRFRESMLILSNRTNEAAGKCVVLSGMKAFHRGLRVESVDIEKAFLAYLYHVQRQVARGKRHRHLLKRLPTPRRVRYLNDQRKMMAHWQRWLKGVPDSTYGVRIYIEEVL